MENETLYAENSPWGGRRISRGIIMDVVKFGDGSFAVTWSGFNNGGTDWGQAYLQYFDKSGAAVGQRQLIADDTVSPEIYQWEEFTFIEPTFVGDTIEDLEISIDILNTYGQAATINVCPDALNLQDKILENIGDFNYQWKANGEDIVGANDDTLTLTQNQVDKVITLCCYYG